MWSSTWASINMGVTQVLAVACIVLSLVLTWPDPPVALLIAGGVVLLAAWALFFQPFSKTL